MRNMAVTFATPKSPSEKTLGNSPARMSWSNSSYGWPPIKAETLRISGNALRRRGFRQSWCPEDPGHLPGTGDASEIPARVQRCIGAAQRVPADEDLAVAFLGGRDFAVSRYCHASKTGALKVVATRS